MRVEFPYVVVYLMDALPRNAELSSDRFHIGAAVEEHLREPMKLAASVPLLEEPLLIVGSHNHFITDGHRNYWALLVLSVRLSGRHSELG